MKKMFIAAAGWALFSLYTAPGWAAERQIVRGNAPRAVAELNLTAIGRVAGTNMFQIAIGLPLRNRESLASFLKELYTPGNRNFRKYLTPQQFTERFGPAERDYQDLIGFARANGLMVTHTFAGRTLLSVKASVADIERVFHVTMRLYQHPIEARTFCAPDTEPSLDLKAPVLFIGGLDNYFMPQRVHGEPVASQGKGVGSGGFQGGSGPGGSFKAEDILSAYMPGVNAYANSQSIALLEYSGFYLDLVSDYMYENGILPYDANSVVQNWELDGATGNPNINNSGSYGEVEVDIEMALAAAPGISSVIVYELPPPTTYQGIPPDEALTLMAEQDLCNQISSSWEYQVTPTTDQLFQRLAAQGQSFFQASGDGGGRTGSNVYSPFDDAYITLVGGTELTTSSGGAWSSEKVWNDTHGESGGGISPNYPIPWWQQGVNVSLNGASTTMRNMPDVAIVADNVYAFYGEAGNGKSVQSGGYEGTSVAAPLWAGLMAVINEAASAKSLPPVGFINPIVYEIGTGNVQSHSYASCFHDIINGNNENSYSPNAFNAVAGYDLCTGWGTPNGQKLINALINP